MRLNVGIDAPLFHIRPNTTDWKYALSLTQLRNFTPLAISVPFDPIDIISEAIHHVGARFSGGEQHPALSRIGPLGGWRRRGVDVLFCHRRLPLNADIPVVWQYAVADPEMQLHSGVSVDQVDIQYSRAKSEFQFASAIQLSTDAEVRRHCDVMPDLVGKFYSIPFFLPHILPIDYEALESKFASFSPVKILFVGRDAMRKGLDLLVHSLQLIKSLPLYEIELTIVSPMKDCRNLLQGRPWIRHIERASAKEVGHLMRDAHLFVMPSRYETYGLSLIEAMAAGCAIIGPPWEVQREILGYGRAGINVKPDIQDIVKGLTTMLGEYKVARQYAKNALDRYQEKYAPNVVATLYSNLFSLVADRR